MRERSLNIPMRDGTANAVIFEAESPTVRPAVIMIVDIFGVRAANKDLARSIAEAGYTVLVPNVFYRFGDKPLFDFPVSFGDKRTLDRLAELTGPLTPAAMRDDGRHYVNFLRAQESVSQGKMGIAGYCFGGPMSLRIAAAMPEAIGAMASFHGGHLCTDKPDSPHLDLPQVEAQLYFGHADNDQSMNAAAILKFEDALKKWGGIYQQETYAGAEHGWTMNDRPIYNKEQADRALHALLELLNRALKK